MSYPRLDDWLVSSGHYSSRARARDAIKRGCVTMTGSASVKPSRSVIDPKDIAINDPAKKFVSRAALKLDFALKETGWSPEGQIALDIGASTGGFCQVLLNSGAEHVFGIDVGHGQMEPKLGQHKRLTSIEGLNARDLTPEHIGKHAPQFITSDVSFISLKLALPPALDMASPGAKGIFLVKPQFEVGKERLGKGGIVRTPELARECAEDLKHWLGSFENWTAIHLLPSPVMGGDGNIEFLLTGEKYA